MYQQGIIGHVGIDFVTFFDAYSDFSKTLGSRSEHWRDGQSSFMLFNFLLSGRLIGSREYLVPLWLKQMAESRRSVKVMLPLLWLG